MSKTQGNGVVGVDPSEVDNTLMVSQEDQRSKPSREMTEDTSAAKVDGQTEMASASSTLNARAPKMSPPKSHAMSPGDPGIARLIGVTRMPECDL